MRPTATRGYDAVIVGAGPAGLSAASSRVTTQRHPSCSILAGPSWHGVAIREEPVNRLVGRGGRLERIEFAAGPPLRRAALFFATRQKQRCDLAMASRL